MEAPAVEKPQEEENHQQNVDSDEEDNVFEDAPKPALRRTQNQNGQEPVRKRPTNRIKSWYIKGPIIGPQVTDATPSAVPAMPVCDLRLLASEAEFNLSDWDAAFVRSVSCSPDGSRLYMLLSNSFSVFRLCNNKLTQRELRLSDLGDKLLQPSHISVDEADRLIFVSGEVPTGEGDTRANLLARFRLPSDEDWESGGACKYLGRTKLFENQEKFGCLVHQSFQKEPEETEQKENHEGEKPEEDSGLWIASPQASQNVYEKTQIFKLAPDFKHKPCTVSLGRQGVVYLPKYLNIDADGWAYASVDRIEAGPTGSTKLWSSRLLTFPTRPPNEGGTAEHTRDWMRVNSWQFQGVTPGGAVSVIPGHKALVLDRERGKLHQVTWYGSAIQGQGSAECHPVTLRHALGLNSLPDFFDGIASMGPTKVLLHHGSELFEVQFNDLK